MRARHGDAQRRARPRRRASRGSASVEYGLIVGLIGAVLCLGIGVVMQEVFADIGRCFLAQLQGQPAPAGCGGGTDGVGGSTGGGSSGGSGGTSSSPTNSPTESPSATPTPTATVTPTS